LKLKRETPLKKYINFPLHKKGNFVLPRKKKYEDKMEEKQEATIRALEIIYSCQIPLGAT